MHARDERHVRALQLAATGKFAQVLAATSAAASGCQYYKQGLYRGPDVNGRSDVLWIGPTARGASFAAVEQAAFATGDGF